MTSTLCKHASLGGYKPSGLPPRTLRVSLFSSALKSPSVLSKHQHSRSSCSQQPSSSIICSSAAEPAATSDAAIDPVKQAEMVKGCRTLLAELQGLDFPRNEVKIYFTASTKLPRGFKGDAQDMAPARTVLDLLLKKDADGDNLPPSAFTDMAGLALTQAVLNELWRWRRRGGGMNYDESEGRPSETALAEIQNFKPEDIDRVSSSLLDNLPISDQQKQDMSGGVQTMVFGAFQGAVWGSLALTILFLIIFNFARSA